MIYTVADFEFKIQDSRIEDSRGFQLSKWTEF
jgi:hypothetical protein